MRTEQQDLGRAAYEARWAGMTLGPRGAAPAWDDLGPEGQAVWQWVAEAAIAAAIPQPLHDAAAAYQRAPRDSRQEANAWLRFRTQATAFAWQLLRRGP